MKREITADDFIEEIVTQRNAAQNDAATKGAIIRLLERDKEKLKAELAEANEALAKKSASAPDSL